MGADPIRERQTSGRRRLINGSTLFYKPDCRIDVRGVGETGDKNYFTGHGASARAWNVSKQYIGARQAATSGSILLTVSASSCEG